MIYDKGTQELLQIVEDYCREKPQRYKVGFWMDPGVEKSKPVVEN
jgi:hypothetical protein